LPFDGDASSHARPTILLGVLRGLAAHRAIETEHSGQIGYATWRTLITDLADGRQFVLRAGSSHQVASEVD